MLPGSETFIENRRRSEYEVIKLESMSVFKCDCMSRYIPSCHIAPVNSREASKKPMPIHAVELNTTTVL